MRKALFFLALCSFCEHTLLAQCGPNGHLGPIGNGQKSCIYTIGSGNMTWPSAPGVSVCTGTPCTAWGTSLTGLSQTLIGYLANVTSDIQAQLNAKATTAAPLGSLTAAVVKSASGVPSVAAAADVYGLWSGTKDSSHFMAGDGTMQTAGTSTSQMVSWVLCAAASCSTSDAVAIPFRVAAAGTSNTCYIAAGTAPTGADLIVQVTQNGLNAFTVTLTAGTAANTFLTSTPTMTRAAGDVLKASITQVGSTVPGMSVMLTCTLQ
jgi:hypothetical protein